MIARRRMLSVPPAVPAVMGLLLLPEVSEEKEPV
jgi:hypothetical protein